MYKLSRQPFRFLKIGLLTSLACLPTISHANLSERADIQQFIRTMVSQHKFDAGKLTGLFKQTIIKPSIIKAITRPAEKKEWYDYRPIFITQSRIDGGVEFWKKHRETLAKAEQKYGVPAEIIIAIIGVETRYGRHAGKYRVMDSLATLAFEYPKRSKFFRSELEQYLLMTREEGVDPMSLLGSYAGAMGQPQFISSSYRRYAIDFNADGKRDIWNNTADAIGSVANYLSVHGWKKGAAITTQLTLNKAPAKGLLNKSLKPYTKVADLRQQGISIPNGLSNTEQATLMALKAKQGNEYWLGLKNFYVITRYNHSALYAMAVYQLSQAIKKQSNA